MVFKGVTWGKRRFSTGERDKHFNSPQLGGIDGIATKDYSIGRRGFIKQGKFGKA